jgi:hypothetical protein
MSPEMRVKKNNESMKSVRKVKRHVSVFLLFFVDLFSVEISIPARVPACNLQHILLFY